MRFLSKIVLICNSCFLVAMLLRFIELKKRAAGNADSALPFQALEGSIIVLGYGAIFINVIFNLMVLFSLLTKKQLTVSKWIIWSNFLVLLLQVYYFELYKW